MIDTQRLVEKAMQTFIEKNDVGVLLTPDEVVKVAGHFNKNDLPKLLKHNDPVKGQGINFYKNPIGIPESHKRYPIWEVFAHIVQNTRGFRSDDPEGEV